MDTSDFQFAPGCFGSALGYADDATCQSCPFAPDCAGKSAVALAELRALLGVVVREKRAGKGTLPKKAKEVFERLGKSAREVRASLMGGENPYPTEHGFMGDACHILLISQDTTVAFLATVIAARCKVKATVATIYARQAVQILRHCDAIVEDGERISLRRG